MKTILFISSLLLFLSSCEGAIGRFQAAQGDSAPAEEGDETDVVDPVMISGAYLTCEWVEEDKGRGGCVIKDQNNNNQKVDFKKEGLYYSWDILYDDFINSYPAPVVNEMPQSSQWHIEFILDASYMNDHRSSPGATIYAKRVNSKGEFQPQFKGNFTYVLQGGEISSSGYGSITVSKGESGSGLLTKLGNTVNPDYYFWPNPAGADLQLYEDAGYVMDLGSESIFENIARIQMPDFDPSGYCSSGAGVLTQTTAAWDNTLKSLASMSPFAVNVKRDIAKISSKTTSAAFCTLPIKTSVPGSMSASGSGCHFLLVQKRGVGAIHPFLLIFTDDMLQRAGISAASLENESKKEACIQ